MQRLGAIIEMEFNFDDQERITHTPYWGKLPNTEFMAALATMTVAAAAQHDGVDLRTIEITSCRCIEVFYNAAGAPVFADGRPVADPGMLTALRQMAVPRRRDLLVN
jgi:hypothetical protein